MQVLEEYLKSFRGCLIIISHDRYFMDRVVDHTLVFHGNGIIQDFAGSYSQYRTWKEQNDKPMPSKQGDKQATKLKADPKSNSGKEQPASSNSLRSQNRVRKLSFKERQEMAGCCLCRSCLAGLQARGRCQKETVGRMSKMCSQGRG